MEKQRFIEWELENDPHMYDKPKSYEFIDRQTLTHVICNVDCPEDVDFEAFQKVINAVAETLDLFPYFKLPEPERVADLDLLTEAGFEIRKEKDSTMGGVYHDRKDYQNLP